MQNRPCSCCKKTSSNNHTSTPGYGFNRLSGEDREWAANNRVARSEHCVRVKGGKRFGGPDWQKTKCGDGTMGFSNRRKGQEGNQMEVGLAGQLKKKRGTLVRPRSARSTASRRGRRIDGSRCCLISSSDIIQSTRDPIVTDQLRIVHKKSKRARKRNHTARRGHKRSMKMAA